MHLHCWEVLPFLHSAPAVCKIQVLRAQDFYILLALNCKKADTSQHWRRIKSVSQKKH